MNKSKHFLTTLGVAIVLVDAWSEPINPGSPLNSDLVDVHAYISADPETIFFASNRPGVFGSADIYVSTRTKGSEK